MKLSTVAPEQRGESVRVVQNLGHSEDPPHADRVHGGTTVYVHSPIWIGGQPHHHHHNHARPAPGGGAGSVGGGHSGGGAAKPHGKTGGGGSTVAKSKEADARAWLVLAAVAAVGLAATEGARYDGWVKLHPMHPVHLYGPYGEHSVLPLAHIDQQAAQWAHHAVVRESEGPWHRLGRAPLNRKGFTYSVILGGGDVPLIGADPLPGFLGHIQFGYFPTRQIGLQLDIAMGWADDDNGDTVYISKNSLELQSHLVRAGRVHAGLFGQVGLASRFDDGIEYDDNSTLYGGGALLQLDWTTRLALTARLGSTRAFGEWSNEVGLGISIY